MLRDTRAETGGAGACRIKVTPSFFANQAPEAQPTPNAAVSLQPTLSSLSLTAATQWGASLGGTQKPPGSPFPARLLGGPSAGGCEQLGWAHLSRGSGCPGHCPSPPRGRVGGGGLGVFACLYFHHEGCPVAQSGSCRAGSLLSGLCGAHPFLVPPASMCLVSPSATNGGQTPKSSQAQGGTPSSLEVEQRPGNCWLFFFFFLNRKFELFWLLPIGS